MLAGLMVCLAAGCATKPKAASNQAAAPPIPRLELGQVLAGGASGLEVGRRAHPAIPQQFPIERYRIGVSTPDLARVEVWADEQGRVVLLGAVLHEQVQADDASYLAGLGLSKAAPAGHLIGQYRPRPGDRAATQSHRMYYTRVTVYATNRPDVWVSYERDRQLYAIYRGDGPGAMAQAQRIQADATQHANATHPVHGRMRVLERWNQLKDDWERPGTDRIRRRLTIFSQFANDVSTVDNLPRLDDTFDPQPPRLATLRDELVADAANPPATLPRYERFVYQMLAQFPRALEMYELRPRVATVLARSPALDTAVGYEAIHQALMQVAEVLSLSPKENTPAAALLNDIRRDAIRRAADRDRAAGLPSLAKLEEVAIRLTPWPDPAIVKRYREKLVEFDRLTDVVDRLNWLMANRPPATAPATSDIRIHMHTRALWALLGLTRPAQSQAVAAAREAFDQGLYATATMLALKAHAVSSDQGLAGVSLAQAVAPDSQLAQRAAAALWLDLAPPLHANNTDAHNLLRRMLEPPSLDAPLIALAGVLPDGLGDHPVAAEALGRPERFVQVSRSGDVMTIEPTDAAPERTSGWTYTPTDLTWLGVTTEVRQEAARLAEEREKIDAEHSRLKAEAAWIDQERERLNRMTDELKRWLANNTPTRQQIEARTKDGREAETALNVRIDAYNAAQRIHNEQVERYNKDVTTNNLRRNEQRAKGVLALRERLDSALNPWFDRQLEAYAAQRRASDLPSPAVEAEIAWARWFIGRGDAPSGGPWPATGKAVLERRLAFYEAELWRLPDTTSMAQAFMKALDAAGVLDELPRMEELADRFARQYGKEALIKTLAGARHGNPHAEKMLRYVQAIRFN